MGSTLYTRGGQNFLLAGQILKKNSFFAFKPKKTMSIILVVHTLYKVFGHVCYIQEPRYLLNHKTMICHEVQLRFLKLKWLFFTASSCTYQVRLLHHNHLKNGWITGVIEKTSFFTLFHTFSALSTPTQIIFSHNSQLCAQFYIVSNTFS